MILDGKVALITGATRGLGYAIAQAYAREGARIVVASRKQDACDRVAAELRALGTEAKGIAVHVGEWDRLSEFEERAVAAFGRIDVLVNNAGIAPTAPRSVDLTEDLFDKIVAVNFKGPFRLAALVGERMKANGGGSIINVSSIAAIRPEPAYPVYAGAKAALNAMTRSHAFEFGPSVRVNAIMCGPFWTDISAAWREELDENSPSAIGRIGRPEEIASTALYLADDRSSFTTGTIVRLDGGVL